MQISILVAQILRIFSSIEYFWYDHTLTPKTNKYQQQRVCAQKRQSTPGPQLGMIARFRTKALFLGGKCWRECLRTFMKRCVMNSLFELYVTNDTKLATLRFNFLVLTFRVTEWNFICTYLYLSRIYEFYFSLSKSSYMVNKIWWCNISRVNFFEQWGFKHNALAVKLPIKELLNVYILKQ